MQEVVAEVGMEEAVERIEVVQEEVAQVFLWEPYRLTRKDRQRETVK